MGTVGETTAQKLIAFMETEIPRVEEFLLKPREYWSEFKTEHKYLILYSIANKIEELVKDKRFKEFYAYISDTDREYISVLISLVPHQKRKLFVSEHLIDITMKHMRAIAPYL